ncbi:hypothetical protein HHE92_12035 [Pseudoalteromonas arctica]|uniref:hypothetical protein n=1 Tax=Pseudoalteromonas arctica TaxID=394751 RepID=UPI00145C204C|nr:hypothetical protein [Pseudoalteromonas arctica]NMP80528.1 hypothetical protein [Pseudoalteromonas arctica]
MDEVIKYVALVSNFSTILASAIAIFLFVSKRKAISSVFGLLINYTYQLSLSEIKEKLEKLNDYNAKDSEQNEIIVNILNEIVGQIRGNDKLKVHFSEILETLEGLLSDRRKLTEPRKRAIVSELRERLRHLNIKNIDDLVGE